MPSDISDAVDRLGNLIDSAGKEKLTFIQQSAEENAWNEDARAAMVQLLIIGGVQVETIVRTAVDIADALAGARAKRLTRRATNQVDDLLSTVVANGENLRRNVECTTYDRPCPVCDVKAGGLCKTKAGGFWLAGTAHEGR